MFDHEFMLIAKENEIKQNRRLRELSRPAHIKTDAQLIAWIREKKKK